uniref:sigma-70 family RNA polymerase sigma factor n=1 Tax=Nocardiopsis chromatogenes TaxID=280239 RepID=UPI000379E7BF|nr:sigma-70 family RNA polymerase sigma factor [Nocardiopsis chromatogenes]
MTTTALRVAEREFYRLVPDPLHLEASDVDAGLAEPVMGLLAVRDLLLEPGTSRGVKDAVWRVVIARARWMTGALGLAMPALRGVRRRCSRGLTTGQAAEVESEIALAFIVEVRRIDTGYAQLSWYLRCRAQRAGLRARRRVLAEPAPADTETDPADEGAEAAGSTDEVLQRAVTLEVLTQAEAELIGATRLEGTALREVADRSGEGYWALAKRRSRAEERLAAAIRGGELDPGTALEGRPGGLVVDSVPPLVSKAGWALAL